MARLRCFVLVCGSFIWLGVGPVAPVLIGPPLRAESIFQWTSPTGGSFADRANWVLVGGDPDVAPPDGDDVALFSLDSTYGVSFDTSAINAALRVTGGDVTFRPSTTIGQQYTIEGSALLQGGSLTLAGNSALDTATMTLAAMDVEVGGNSTLTVLDGNTVATSTGGLMVGRTGNVDLADGIIRVGGPAPVRLESGGLLTGDGTVEGDVVSDGRVDPSRLGNPGGILKVEGNYTQTTRGTLQIDLGGMTRRSFDSLSVSGHATLGGILEIVAPPDFIPMPGTGFPIITYETREGDFDETVNSTSRRGVYFDVDYDDTGGTGTVRVTALPGDIDLDGDVDRLDSALFAPNLGASGATWTSGDFDADGMTTLTDLSTQQAHMGMTAPSPAPTPIPEPPAGLASLAAILGAFLTRRAVAAARRVPWRPRTHRLGLPG